MESELMRRELELEEECLGSGVMAYRRRTTQLIQKGLETATDYGKSMLGQSIEPLSQAIIKFISEAGTRPGRRHHAVKYLEEVEPDVAAMLCCRVVFDGISKQNRYQTIALTIGHRIEDEMRFRQFGKDNKPLYQGVMKNLAKHPIGYQYRVKRSMLAHAANKFGVRWQHWSTSDRLHLGSKLIDLFIESVGAVRIVRKHGQKDTAIHLEPTEQALEWIDRYQCRSELLHPQYLPMLCPPRRWTTPTDGGYYSKRFKATLVKARTKGYLKEMKYRQMPLVYQAVNALQETPWKVNVPMLTVVREIMESGLEIKGVPPRTPPERLPKPADYATNEDAKKAWKRRAGEIFRKELEDKSKRIQVGTILRIAEKFADEPSIYFPIQLDFRGRIYTLPQQLNPQGCDLAKSLLTFANGKPLGKDGTFWLAVHIANTFGYDKCSLQERCQWTMQNTARVVSTANDPLEDRWWLEADKPFQFLAAAIEWVGYMTDGGETYVCGLPIMVDGSCNGLQHFSAMLRDEVCGRHVNLVPSLTPSDIYSAVADGMMARLAKDAADGVPYAAQWFGYGITRKMAKRPVMVLPYGGTRESFRTYLMDAAIERGNDPFADKLHKAIQYLTNLLTAVMKDVVRGPRVAMDWLQQAAREMARQELPVCWSTPSGFLVQQKYPETKSRRVDTQIGGQVVKLSLSEETAKLNRRKQAQAIAPNFVHSLDAAALVLTVCKCMDQNVASFAAIHDSYGTLAADMWTLQTALRESFVSMYEGHDVIAEFAQEVGVGLPLPSRGGLDLRGVLRSDFFFA